MSLNDKSLLWSATSYGRKVIQLDTLMFVFNMNHHNDILVWIKERFNNRPKDCFWSIENKQGTPFKLYDIIEFKNMSDAMEFKLRFVNV
jgi:hypothetical protein